MRVQKGDVIREVTAVSIDTVWWRHDGTTRERHCTLKAWRRWCMHPADPYAPSPKEV